MGRPRITVLGGGTGSFTILQGLKEITPHLSAIVNMCDDGGSTGVLRDELGVLPPGDARQCLVALSEHAEIRDIFSYRFATGRLEGQSLGNIILSGLELQHGSFEKAVEVASKILRIRGKVLPVVLGDHQLVMQDADEEITGQYAIRMHAIASSAARVRLEPVTTANPKALEAIRKADLVVIAPGDLYSSLLPVCSVNGIAEALSSTKATVVMIANLVNKPTQTPDWHVRDYVTKLEEYIGEGAIDVVLYNDEPISHELLEKYAADGEFPVRIDTDELTKKQVRFIPARLVSQTISERQKGDTVAHRSYIRHDPNRVREELEKLL